MQQKFLIPAFLLLVGGIFTQCSKKEDQPTLKPETATLENTRTRTNLEDRIESKLSVSQDEFVKKTSLVRINNVKNQSVILVQSETEETWFSVEESVYYVEAALN